MLVNKPGLLGRRSVEDNNMLPKGYFAAKPPKARHWDFLPSLGRTIAIALIAVASAIYIGQFIWSFKVEADRKLSAEREQAERIIHNRLAKMCSLQDRIDYPETCRSIPE